MLRIQNIKVPIEKAKNKEEERRAILDQIIKKTGSQRDQIRNVSIYRKSIDARKKNEIFFVYACDFESGQEDRLLKKARKLSLIRTPDMSYQEVISGDEKPVNRPIIVGSGPAGLFAGLFLARRGYRPVLLERGDDVDTRTRKIERFWQEGILDPESNVQFGEGGAGTFSDGKLTTLINDRRCRNIIEEFIEAGAPEDILYKSKPHIGTDILRTTVKNLRKKIIALGGEVRFGSKLTDILIKDNQVVGITINGKETLPCDVLLVAIGHSARDTFELLYNRGLHISQKAFSIGVRVEHRQKMINCAQYGDNHEVSSILGAADYKLSYHSANGRSAYTFCMCPGGTVVAAASEENTVVTNGMSEYKRDAENANAALLVNVTPQDFGSDHPLAGVEFQRKWERLAFEAGGGNYFAPAQTIGSFLKRSDKRERLGEVQNSYRPGITLTEIENCLPDYVVETMREALLHFDEKLKGFASPDGLLTGVETRSSSPIRINRDENHLSNIGGVYPVGEGAGYAGGIMSSAVDGVKTAEKVMERYQPIE